MLRKRIVKRRWDTGQFIVILRVDAMVDAVVATMAEELRQSGKFLPKKATRTPVVG